VHSRVFTLPLADPRSGSKAASAGPTQEPRSTTKPPMGVN